jgi:hypothetical protein
MAGNVSISIKANKQGNWIQDFTGFKETLWVGRYRQDNQSTPVDDWLNAIVFLGSMLQRREPPLAVWQDSLKKMESDLLGEKLIDHVVLNIDLFSWRRTWGKELENSTVWPALGNRIHPSPGLWFRGVEYGRTPYIGAIASQNMPPMQSPGVDNIPGITSLDTCVPGSLLTVDKLTPRQFEIGLKYNKTLVVSSVNLSYEQRRLFGTRWVVKDKNLWLEPKDTWWDKKDNWAHTQVLPPGLYTLWECWAKDLVYNQTFTGLYIFGGYVPYLHFAYPWNFNTEHWTAGGNGEPICIGVSDVKLQQPSGLWQKAPAFHYHSKMLNPNHKVYTDDKNMILISTEPQNAREVSEGEIWTIGN